MELTGFLAGKYLDAASQEVKEATIASRVKSASKQLANLVSSFDLSISFVQDS